MAQGEGAGGSSSNGDVFASSLGALGLGGRGTKGAQSLTSNFFGSQVCAKACVDVCLGVRVPVCVRVRVRVLGVGVGVGVWCCLVCRNACVFVSSRLTRPWDWQYGSTGYAQ